MGYLTPVGEFSPHTLDTDGRSTSLQVPALAGGSSGFPNSLLRTGQPVQGNQRLHLS